MRSPSVGLAPSPSSPPPKPHGAGPGAGAGFPPAPLFVVCCFYGCLLLLLLMRIHLPDSRAAKPMCRLPVLPPLFFQAIGCCPAGEKCKAMLRSSCCALILRFFLPILAKIGHSKPRKNAKGARAATGGTTPALQPRDTLPRHPLACPARTSFLPGCSWLLLAWTLATSPLAPWSVVLWPHTPATHPGHPPEEQGRGRPIPLAACCLCFSTLRKKTKEKKKEERPSTTLAPPPAHRALPPPPLRAMAWSSACTRVVRTLPPSTALVFLSFFFLFFFFPFMISRRPCSLGTLPHIPKNSHAWHGEGTNRTNRTNRREEAEKKISNSHVRVSSCPHLAVLRTMSLFPRRAPHKAYQKSSHSHGGIFDSVWRITIGEGQPSPPVRLKK